MGYEVGSLSASITLSDAKFTSGLDRAKAKLAGFDEQVENSSRKTSRLTSALKTVGRGASVAFATGSSAIAAYTVKLTRTGAAYNSLQQNSRAALTTLMGSAKAANAQMDKLDAFARNSPFSKDVFIRAQQQLLGFGMEAKKVIPTMDALQNAVAATGGSGQQLSDITFVLAQIQAAGKITGQDLLQLGQRGIDAAGLIGKGMGKSGAEIRKMITAGQLDATKAIDLLVAGMQEKFGGATANIKQQWSGALDTFKASQRDLGALLMKPFIDPRGGGYAVTWARSLAKSTRNVTATLERANAVGRATHSTAEKISRAFERIERATSNFNARDLNKHLAQIAQYKAPIAAVGTALGALGGRTILSSIPVVGQLAAAFNPLVLAFGAVVATSPELQSALGVTLRELKPLAPVAGQIAKSFGDLFNEGIRILTPALRDLGTGAAQLLLALTPLATGSLSLLKAALPLVELGAKLVSMLAQLPAPLLAAGAALLMFRRHSEGVKGALTKVYEELFLLPTRLGDVHTAFSKSAPVQIWTSGMKKASNASSGAARMVARTGTAAKAAGSAISAAFGGPVGLAVAGLGLLTTVVSSYAEKQAAAKQETADFAQRVVELGGSASNAAREMALQKAQQEGLLKTAKQYGISVRDVTDAMLGNEDALKRVYAATEQAKESAQVVSGDIFSSGVRALQGLDSGVRSVFDAVTKQKNATDELSDSQGRSTEQIQAATDALHAHQNAVMNDSNAQLAAIDAGYALTDAQTRLNEAVSAGEKLTLTATGAIDTSTQKGREAAQALSGLAAAAMRNADSMEKAGKSQSDINNMLTQSRAAFVNAATAMGMGKNEAQKFADTVKLIPDFKATHIDLRADTKPAMDKINEAINSIKDEHGKIIVDAATEPALAEVLKLKGAIEIEPGVLKIDADKNPAEAQLIAQLAEINTSTGVATIDAVSQPARDKLAAYLNSVKASKETTTIFANSDPARQALSSLLQGIRSSGATTRINGNADPARQAAQQARTEINNTRAQMRIDADGGPAFSVLESIIGRASTGFRIPMRLNANGNYYEPRVTAYANGTERHIAQIARAGDLRVWAEPETGGEAYIPLSPSKRARSTQILHKVANEFGYQLVSSRARGYSEGGTTLTSHSKAADTAATVYHVTINNPVAQPLSKQMSDRAALELLQGVF